jgi:hypothetical protein
MAGPYVLQFLLLDVRYGEIAIRVLQEQKPTYNEQFFFTLTRFDGTQAVI